MVTEYGCGTARCGACTVLLDNVAIRSCVTPVRHATGDITTMEGLDHSDALAVVQEAWVAEKVPQYGYCRSGQIMAAVSLLCHRKVPTTPTSRLPWPATSAVTTRIRSTGRRSNAPRRRGKPSGPGPGRTGNRIHPRHERRADRPEDHASCRSDRSPCWPGRRSTTRRLPASRPFEQPVHSTAPTSRPLPRRSTQLPNCRGRRQSPRVLHDNDVLRVE